MKPTVIVFACLITLFNSCNNIKAEIDNTYVNNGSVNNIISERMNEAITRDSIKYSNSDPLVYLLTGQLISDNHKNALLMTLSGDSLKVKLFELKEKNWNKVDELMISKSFGQYDFKFKDYDFDGYNDIYIQKWVSNGYAMSRGELLIYNPEEKKLIPHPEAAELANMQPDPVAKAIVSDTFTDYKIGIYPDHIISRWIDGKLKMIRVEKQKAAD